MNDNYLRRLRRRARRHHMVIHKNRGVEGGYYMADVSDGPCGFDVFGGPVSLKDIEERLDWLEEDE